MMEALPLADPAVQVLNAVKSFGGTRAVDGVALEVGKGEFFSLLGPSGCGKTTLMRLIAGFEEPDRGSIAIDGADMAGVPPNRRPVNMMFQSYALFPHLTVEANVAFGLRLMGSSRFDIEARTRKMLELVRLEDLGARKPNQLSGGQRQRVALARALALGPKVLLLDEPLGALDKKLRQEMQSELKRIQAETGATFIVVTHDQEEAMALSDRMAVMRDGRIVQIDRPDAIYDRPANAYVAGFVGDVNLMSATVMERPGNERSVEIEGVEGPLQLAVPAGADLQAALRPERLVVSDKRTGAADRWIGAHVEARSHLGPAIAYRLRTSDGRMLSALVPSAAEDSAHAPGAAVWAGFRTADIRMLGD